MNIQIPIKYDNEIKRWITPDNSLFDRLHPKTITGLCLDYIALDDEGPSVMELVIENNLNKEESPYVRRFYIHIDKLELSKLVSARGKHISIKVIPSDYLSYLTPIEWSIIDQ